MLNRKKRNSGHKMFKFPDTSMINIDAITAIMPMWETKTDKYGNDKQVMTGRWTVTLNKNGSNITVTIDESEYQLLESMLDVYEGE